MDRISIVATIAIAIILSASLQGEINPVLNYQGYMLDSLGQPYPDGPHDILFTIYDQPTGDNDLWSETQTLEFKRGFIHAYLGSEETFPEAIFETYPLYLGIKYEEEPEFAERHMLGSTVYAFFAHNSRKLEGHGAEHFIDSTVLDDAIAVHTADPSAHHTKTIDASELTQGTLDPERLPLIEVDSANITDGGITTADLADSIVTGEKIVSGAISNEHLSTSAFTGEHILDGSITAVDLADSTITGDKISTGAISSEHLVDASITGADIANSSITGADIQDGSILSYDLALGSVTSDHIQAGTITAEDIANNTITGSRILDGTIGNADLGWHSVGTAQIVDNSVRSIDVYDNSLTATDIVDEPGVNWTSASYLTSVNNTLVNWMTLTVSAPSAGYLLVFFNTTTQLASGEIAQAGISNSPSSLGTYTESRIVSTAFGTGATMSMMVSEVYTVAAAGDISVYANVRASASSTGEIDFLSGRLQAIFITTGY